jgi:hypothetical protein
MRVTWAASTDGVSILGEVDGHHFELSGEGSSRGFSFGEWSIGCSWHIRQPGAPASLDGMGQLDPVDDLVVLRGSVPTGSFDVAVVQGDERSAVILLDDGESERPGWIGFLRSDGPSSLLEWRDSSGEVRQLPLDTRVPGLGRASERGQPISALGRLWKRLFRRRIG